MTERQPQEPAPAERGRHRMEELQALSDRDLDAAVAAVVFGQPARPDVAYTNWIGFGLIVEHLRERGYTVHYSFFEPSHVEWMNNLPADACEANLYLPAAVSVVDIRERLRLGQDEISLDARADTLPRAAAIASILICQREQIARLVSCAPRPTWSESRRRQKSESMKRYWQRRKADASSEQS